MNNIYDTARYTLLTNGLQWATIDLKLTVWSGVPTFVPTDITTADIVARGGVARGSSLPIVHTMATPNGTAQTDQVVIPTVSVGPDVTWMTLSKDTGELIMFVDDAEGLPFVANGLDLVVQPDWITARGWFRP